jgi:hypothetical protein
LKHNLLHPSQLLHADSRHPSDSCLTCRPFCLLLRVEQAVRSGTGYELPANGVCHPGRTVKVISHSAGTEISRL